MREEDKTTVVDLSDNPKNAALFFDYVFSLRSAVIMMFYADPLGTPSLYHRIDAPLSLLPLKMQNENHAQKAFVELISAGNRVKGAGDLKVPLEKQGYMLYKTVGDWQRAYNIKNFNILCPSNDNTCCTKSYDCTSLELAQLPLIDTSKAEWDQILKFREDEESVRKLRNLRLFFYENYAGKDKNYVQDDFLKRLEKYENARRDWGFETVTSSIKMLLTSPVTLTSVGTSLAMALFGEPLSALATAGTGATIEIGKMSLHIAKEIKKLSILQRDHPLAYIIDAKKKLE